MMGIRTKNVAMLALLLGLALRAAMPLGYMPAAAGTGLLFELCPDRLPANVTLAGTPASGHHHHSESDSGSQPAAEVDTCQIGHLLMSAAAIDNTAPELAAVLQPAPTIQLKTAVRWLVTHGDYWSRAPPA